MTKNIKVSGVGCCLVDRVYNNISFNSVGFEKYLSVKSGDGGLVPGNLVFREEFENFSGIELDQFVRCISGDKGPDATNIGGPAIVALIHAAQMNQKAGCSYHFCGVGGQDSDGNFLIELFEQNPVNTDAYDLKSSVTPSTIVLSDPKYNHGNGERIFINSIGSAWTYSPENLNNVFFESDVVVFGATALVPLIHDQLETLLDKAKSKGSFTIVNTVYDFRNEKANPDQKWPLGASDKSYAYIDLLVVDLEEALRLSGKDSLDDAMIFFKSKGTGAVIATNGSRNIRFYANNDRLYTKVMDSQLPVSLAVADELKSGRKGDTTGCGDNFVGGVIYSVVSQLSEGAEKVDLEDACMWGVVSGGYACFYVGGTYLEKKPGEKRRMIIPYYEKYQKQINE
jgi:sugar/nucleoside kinase (ribokinase family)